MNNFQPLNVLSFGAGAIGTYIGGSLAAAGHRVVFIEQPAASHKLAQNGISLDLGIDPRRKEHSLIHLTVPQVQFVDSLEAAMELGPFDVALFALKSFDTEPVLAGLGKLAAKLPPILCLQNGVSNEEVIAGFVGSDNVLFGTVTSAIGRKDVGSIVLEKLRGVGIAHGHPMSEKLLEAMDAAYLNPKIFADARAMKWSKMLTNLLANATSAILNQTPAQIFANSVTANIEIRQIRECLEVMRKLGIEVVNLPGTPVKALAFAMGLPLWLSQPFLKQAIGSGRGAKMPSFHIDLYSGRKKSEVDFLNGAVSKAGQGCGVATPVNGSLRDILAGLTDGSIPLEKYENNVQELLKQIG